MGIDRLRFHGRDIISEQGVHGDGRPTKGWRRNFLIASMRWQSCGARHVMSMLLFACRQKGIKAYFLIQVVYPPENVVSKVSYFMGPPRTFGTC